MILFRGFYTNRKELEKYFKQIDLKISLSFLSINFRAIRCPARPAYPQLLLC